LKALRPSPSKATGSRYRWFVVAVFFAFMLLHQADKLLIGPLTTPIMETFGIDEAQMGAVFTGAAAGRGFPLPAVGLPVRPLLPAALLALASAIWGSTTWLSAIAPTFPLFLASRASTGVDDSSYPGLYSLISDYFGPAIRGRVYGLLQLSQPLGYMVGLLVATLLSGAIGWRGVFYVTGSLGIVVAVVILLGVREVPRSRAEPEMAGLEQIGVYRFDKRLALGLFSKRSLLLLFAQGFVGVFPWNVITYWFFRYLETERGYSQGAVLGTMAPAVLVLAGGYFVGGALGDLAFKRTRRGRVLVAMVGVITGAVLLTLTMNTPVGNQGQFLVPPDRHRPVHPLRLGQRDRHRLRHHPAGGAQHRPVGAVLHRERRRGPGPADGRPDRPPTRCTPPSWRSASRPGSWERSSWPSPPIWSRRISPPCGGRCASQSA
jgi:MFS transporter, Spinster family, sphingosine-1-phosphate transporter